MAYIVCIVVPHMYWWEVGMSHIVCSVGHLGGRFGTWGVPLSDLPTQTPSTLVVLEVFGNL